MSHHDLKRLFSENENCDAKMIIPTNSEAYRNRNRVVQEWHIFVGQPGS